MTFQERLAQLSTKRDLSSAQLAARLQRERKEVEAWLSGAGTPDIAALSQLADLFEVSTDYLLGRTEAVTAASLGISAPAVELIGKLRAVKQNEAGMDPADRRTLLDVFNEVLEAGGFVPFLTTMKILSYPYKKWDQLQIPSTSYSISEMEVHRKSLEQSINIIIYKIQQKHKAT